MNQYHNRIERLSQELGFKTVHDFAINGLGYNSSEKLNRLKKPEAKPSVSIIMDIINRFDDVNAEWLLVGRGTMLKSQSPSEEVQLIPEVAPDSIEGKIAMAVYKQISNKMEDVHAAVIKLLIDIEELKKNTSK